MHLLNFHFFRCINSVGCIKKRHADSCIHKMWAILSVLMHGQEVLALGLIENGLNFKYHCYMKDNIKWKFLENNVKIGYESQTKSIFLFWLHALKFKIYLIYISLITWYLSNLAIFWLCGWDLAVCARVSWGTNPGDGSVFPHISWVHNSVVVKTHRQQEYMHSLHTHIIWHPLSTLCPQLPDVGCSPSVLTDNIWILTLISFSFIKVDRIFF